MLTNQQIQDKIDSMDTCSLNQILIYLTKGMYTVSSISPYDLPTIIGLIQVEIKSRLTSGMTIEELCPGPTQLSTEALQLINELLGRSSIIIQDYAAPPPDDRYPLPPIHKDATTDTGKTTGTNTGATTDNSANQILTNINWWQVGVFGLLFYIFIKKS